MFKHRNLFLAGSGKWLVAGGMYLLYFCNYNYDFTIPACFPTTHRPCPTHHYPIIIPVSPAFLFSLHKYL